MKFKIIRESKEVSEQAMNRLNEKDADVKNSGNSKYVKFADGDKAVLFFLRIL